MTGNQIITTNLLALSKLYGISPKELLRQIQE